MATGGSTEKVAFLGTGTSTAGKKVGEFYLGWSLVSQDKVNKTSKISITYYLSMINYSHSRDYVGWQVFCDGKQIYDSGMTSIAISVSGMKFLCTTTVTLPHAADGTKSFSLSATYTEYRYDNQAVYAQYTNSGSFELPPLPITATLTAADDFYDESNPTIYYDNTSGELVDALDACISFTGEQDDVPYRTVSKTGDSYTFELTDAERVTLRRWVDSGASKSVKFYLRTTIEGSYTYSVLTKTLTLINHEPTLNPIVRDDNAATVELTGNNQKFIRYYSNAYFETGAQAYKEATITDQFAASGGQTINESSGTFEGIGSDSIFFGVMDSRGFAYRDSIFLEFIPYIKLTMSLSAGLLTANGTLDFTIRGKYFSGSFGAKSNEMQVQYAVFDKNGDFVEVPGVGESGWVELGVVSPDTRDDDYSFSYTITGLDYQQQYTITVNVNDSLTPIQSSSVVVAALPVFDWNGDDFHHHTDVVFSNSRTIAGMTTNNEPIVALEACNADGDTTLGRGNYDAGEGNTRIYGNNIYLHPKEKLIINGKEYGASRILWSSTTGSYMNASQTASLTEPISEQPNGIVLVFSSFNIDTAQAADTGWSTHFVPKAMIDRYNGGTQTFFLLAGTAFTQIGLKTLTIEDEAIKGHSNNTSSGSASGITYNNNRFALRYVIGV